MVGPPKLALGLVFSAFPVLRSKHIGSQSLCSQAGREEQLILTLQTRKQRQEVVKSKDTDERS